MPAQRLNPGLIGVAILCFVLTVVFAAGVFTKNGEITALRDGAPGRPATDTVPRLQDQRAALLREIGVLQSDVDLRVRELERADLRLAGHLVHWQGAELYTGVATPGSERGTIGGQNVALRDHRLAMARFALEESGRRLDALKTEYQSNTRQQFPPLDRAIANRNRELAEVNQRISEQDAIFQRDRESLAERLDGLKAENDRFAREQATERSRRLTRITQLEDRIRELLELDLKWLKEIEPIGSILSVEDRSNRVIINLGEAEKVTPGLLFEVFTWDKGVYVEKGMLEVIEVQRGVSVCRILSQHNRRLHPLAKDDRIGNPTFNPRRARTFVVAGEFKHYNKSDLEAFIRRSGGQIAQHLGPGVDFLVAGDRSEREQSQAREYQILGMTEDQVLKYVQPQFVPR